MAGDLAMTWLISHCFKKVLAFLQSWIDGKPWKTFIIGLCSFTPFAALLVAFHFWVYALVVDTFYLLSIQRSCCIRQFFPESACESFFVRGNVIKKTVMKNFPHNCPTKNCAVAGLVKRGFGSGRQCPSFITLHHFLFFLLLGTFPTRPKTKPTPRCHVLTKNNLQHPVWAAWSWWTSPILRGASCLAFPAHKYNRWCAGGTFKKGANSVQTPFAIL